MKTFKSVTATKAQRHEAYKYAHQRVYTEVPYICIRLRAWLFNETGKRPSPDKSILRYFPEFAKLKPEGVEVTDAWWNMYEKSKRVAALEKCINKTKPKTK